MHHLAVMELTDTQFKLIAIGYLIGGVLCAVIAATGFGGRTTGRRVLNGIVAAVCLIYGLYLLLGDATHVIVSFYIMLLPVILLIQAIVAFVQRRKQTGNPGAPTGANAGAAAWPPPQPQATWPPAQGQPAQRPAPGQPVPGQPAQYGQPAQPTYGGATYGQPSPNNWPNQQPRSYPDPTAGPGAQAPGQHRQ